MMLIKKRLRIYTGFTLVELMISVVVMVLMMLAFGMIVTEAQQVVSTSENKIHSNSVADTIRRVVEWDFSHAAANGPLCISSRTDATSGPRFIVRTEISSSSPGRRSKLYNYTSSDGLTSYGLVDARSDYAPLTSNILCRQSWLAPGTVWSAQNNTYFEGDVLNLDVTTLIENPLPPTPVTRTDIDTYINDFLTAVLPDTKQIYLPPQSLADINILWEVLSAEANGVSVMWTDGSDGNADGNIDWYGVGFNPTISSNGMNYVVWKNDPSSQPDPHSPDLTEYQNADDGYRALWTTSNWNQRPKAIKISFRLLDPSIGDIKENTYTTSGGNERAYIKYEIICNLP